MANSFFSWSSSPDRLVPLDTARAADVNGALDYVESGFDSVEVKTKAALKFPDGSDVDALPASGARANKVLTFDGSGNPTVTALAVADIAAADDYAAAALAQAGIATTQAGIATTQAGIASTKAAEAAATAAAINPANLATLTGVQTLTNKTIHGNANTITVDGANAVGFLHVPQLDKTTAYTLVLGDAGKHIHKAGATAFTATIPANTSVAFPIGTAVTFINSAASGAMTIAITTDTMRLAGHGTTGSRTLAAYGMATAIKVAATLWMISGTGLT